MKSLLLASAMAVVLSTPAFAWFNYDTPAAPPAAPAPAMPNINVHGAAQHQMQSQQLTNTITFAPVINTSTPTSTASVAPPVTRAAAVTPATPSPAAAAGTNSNANTGTSDPSGRRSVAGGNPHGGSGGSVGRTISYANLPNLPQNTAYAPSYESANPCVGKGAGVGAQTSWFGLSIGGQHMDYGCAAERTGNLETVGQQIDFEYQCLDDRDFRKAALAAGHPCAADRQDQDVQAVGVVTYRPVSTTPAKAVPAWCARAKPMTDASKAYVQQVCGS